MKKAYNPFLCNVALLIAYIGAVYIIMYYYPVAHLTWDSFYYVKTSITHEYGIRPSGYAYFIDWIYSISQSLRALSISQFTLHYVSSIFLLYAIKKVFQLNTVVYLLTGVLFLLEPVTLYHCNSVLSDLLFSSLTISAMACLLLYVNGGKYLWLVLHVILIFCCIEVRHIGLFYPVFTCVVLALFTKRSLLLLTNVVLIMAVYFGIYRWHVQENKKHYYVSVYSAFSGWTHANNALYTLPLLHIDLSTIKNTEIRAMHKFFVDYMDTSGFKVDYKQPGSGFLWEDKSPLNVLRLKLIDSLKVDYNTSWYLCAPYYHYYGTYIEKHYPFAYMQAYMIPNLKTVVTPVTGEMGDYYTMSYSDPTTLLRYHLEESDLKCVQQIYKDSLLSKIGMWYHTLIIAFAISICIFLSFLKRYEVPQRKGLATIIAFILLFYGLTIYSSWIMYRYLLPIYPLMHATIIIVVCNVWKALKVRKPLT